MANKWKLLKQLEKLDEKTKTTDAEVDSLIERSDRVAAQLRAVATSARRGR
jgi:prefoldin subunit 5